MVNQTARDILQSAKRNMTTIKDAPFQVWGTLKGILRYLFVGKTLVTLFLIAWLLGISFLIIYTSPDKTRPLTDDLIQTGDYYNHVRFFNLHRVWFGEESIVIIIIKLWFYTAILWLLGPILRELAVLFKLRLIL